MIWSRQQDAALKAVDAWYRGSPRKQVFRLFGYAGTGKTTLAKHAAEYLGNVIFATYTGKAAHVLTTKGCPASTIHSLIYLPKEKSRQRLAELERQLIALPVGEERRRRELEREIVRERERVAQPSFSLSETSPILGADAVVIDEVSMVDERMARDLLSFGKPILVLGDPAQLPPVFGGGFFTAQDPDVMLTDIHRQAADNPIIALATSVREGRPLDYGDYGESRVVERHRLDAEEVLAYDQILVGKNVTRRSANARVRSLLGRSGTFPVKQDRLVCLRNNHDVGLLNGSIWSVVDTVCADRDLLLLSLEPEDGGEHLHVEAHPEPFEGARVEGPYWERKEKEEFDFGYALTVHKAQGSQWNSVMVVDESSVFGENRAKHLYTAITRAAERVTVMRNV